MSLTTAKIAGWAFGELLLSGEIEHIDTEVQKALDGVGGGTYAPSSQLIIGGAGLRITTVLDITGAINITGNTTIGNSDADTLSVVATPTFEAPATFNDGIIITATGFDVTGNSRVRSDLRIDGDCDFDGAVDVAGAVVIHDNLNVTTGNTFFCNAFLQVDGEMETNAELNIRGASHVWDTFTVHSGGSLDVNGPADFSGTVTLKSLLSTSGAGRVPMRHSTTLGDGDETVDVTHGNVFELPNDNSATRTYTISNADAQRGDFAVFYVGSNTALANRIRIENADGSLLLNANDGALYPFLWAVFNGASWRPITYSNGV
jgi:hypothetical protein